jgi:hypothetical protein
MEIIRKGGYVLVQCETGKPITNGDVKTDIKGKKRIIRSGEPPKNAEQVGRVLVDDWEAIHPHSLDVCWINEKDFDLREAGAQHG